MVIIIIAAISSIIGSINKKNKQVTRKRQPREINTEDWEDKDPWNDHTETQQPVFREKQSAANSLLTQQTINPEYRQFNKNKKVEKDYATFKRETISTFLNIEENNTAITLEDMPTNTEEWRKAFIYSEIFKRKY
jgi:hypothetical protein